jgi:pimeloyl-ACP methyl ester carboxylesterase
MTVELFTERVEGERGERDALFLHGILGSGQNLRSLARRFVMACPEWNAVLVDLRGHGRSPKGTPGGTLAEVAADVLALETRLPVGAVVGHSFGGKTALEVARRAPASLSRVVVIDSTPGARPGGRGSETATSVIERLTHLASRTFPSKKAFVEAVIAGGESKPIAEWLAMSTERVGTGDEVRFALDLAEIGRFMDSYFTTDLWPVVEQPPGEARIHFVVGARSDVFDASDRARADALAARDHRVTVDVLPAGHWVHVDDFAGLLRVMVERLGGER